jgi:hypothetical protein
MSLHHRHTPGSSPDVFLPRGSRQSPGSVGQFTLFDLPGDRVGDPRIVIPRDFGTPSLLWVPGDGNRPTLWNGAPLAPGDPDPIALTGVPTFIDSPYAGLLSEMRNGAVKRETIANYVLADNHDLVVAIMWFCDAAATYALSCRPGGLVGFDMFANAGFLYSRFCGGGAAGTAQTALAIPGAGAMGFVLHHMVVDRSDAVAGVKQYINGVLNGSAACPVGASNPDKLAFMAQSGAAGAGLRGSVLVAIWMGIGEADRWTAAFCAAFANYVAGLRPILGVTGTYARNSTRVRYPLGPTGRIHTLTPNLPPAGNTEGIGADNQIVSVTPQNYAIPAAPAAAFLAAHIAPGSDAGIVATCVDDSANLGNAREAGPVVVRLTNPTGGTLYQRLGNVIGGAPARSWVSIRAREVAGPCKLGFQTAGGAFTVAVAALAAAYARSSGTVVPGAATDRQCLELPAGADVYVILWCAGTGLNTVIPDEVPSLAAFGVSSTVAAGTVTTAETPTSLEGSVELKITPRGWSAAEAGTPGFLYLSGGGSAVLYVTGGTWRAALDGTTVLDSGIAPADGVAHHVRLRWKTGGIISIEVRLASTMALLARVEAAYDGSLQAAGVWQLADVGAGAAKVDLVTKRNGGS